MDGRLSVPWAMRAENVSDRLQAMSICVLVVVSALDVFAQSASTGALTGTVTDPTGAVLQTATDHLAQPGTARLAPPSPIRTGYIVFPCCRRASMSYRGGGGLWAARGARGDDWITEVRSLATQLAVKA